MQIPSFRRRFLLGALLAASITGTHAHAQSAGRPVRIIVAQTTGTTPDLLARTLAPRLQARLGQSFIVENRAGAAGAIGMEAVAKAPPDGATININVSSTLTIPLFFPVNFDVLTSFTPITLLAGNIFALSVHTSVPATNAREFIAWAKERGGQVNYGSPGNGTHHHLIMEQFRVQTGLALTHIPYKGSAQAFTDLIGGQINAMFLPMGPAQNFARDNKVRILGGSARERSPLTPDIPSLHEQGVKDFHADAWFAAWGPPGMSAELVQRYAAAFHAAVAEPEVRETLAKQGVAVRTSTPEELARMNKAEYEALAKVVRAAKIKGD